MPYPGEICALLAPLAWSVALILYKRSDAPPLSMNLFKNSLALGLLSLTLIVAGTAVPHGRTAEDWLRLVVSGLLGLAIADNLLFEGLKRIGASRLAVVDCVYAPLVVLMSWAVLGETPGPAFAIGAAAVVVGIGLATVEKGALGGGDRQVWVGMLYAGTAISCTAIGVIIAKPVLERSSLLEVTWTRLVVGLLGQAVWIAATGKFAEATVAFRPAKLWRTLVPAAFIGTYVSLILWLGGFKWADASVAAVLNQMATVYTLVLARVVLHERLRPVQIGGVLLAAVGALWIILTRG